MEKSSLAGEGGGCTPTPFQPITITYKVQCALLLKGQILSLYFISTLYVLCGQDERHNKYEVSSYVKAKHYKCTFSRLVTQQPWRNNPKHRLLIVVSILYKEKTSSRTETFLPNHLDN
jgi:hypothetical protein